MGYSSPSTAAFFLYRTGLSVLKEHHLYFLVFLFVVETGNSFLFEGDPLLENNMGLEVRDADQQPEGQAPGRATQK